MPKVSRNRKFVYKRAHVLGSDVPLARLITRALGECGEIEDRQHQVKDEEEGRFCFLNGWRQFGDFWQGSLFTYTEGMLPAGFKFTKGLDELPLETLLELEAGTHLYQEGLYFGVMGSHVILMAAAALRSDDLERYLNWLLVERTEVLAGGTVRLQEEVPPQYHEGWRNVTGVNLQLSLSKEILRAGIDGTPTSPRGILSEAAKELLSGARGDISASRLDSLDRLGIRLQLKFEGRTERLDTAVLDHLATVLRDEDPTMYQLEVRGIGTVRGDQIKLQRKRSIPHYDGRPDADAVRDTMLSWISTLIESGRVRP
jgi:hypothetical protein